MRISYFTQWWPPEPAGMISALATGLANKGHQVHVVTGFPNYPSGRIYASHRVRWRQVETSHGVRIIRVPLYPSHDRSPTKRALNYLSYAASASLIGIPNVTQSEVAYVYHPPLTAAWPARLQRRLRGVPFVLHIQDLWPDSVMDSGMAGSTRAIVEHFLRRMCTKAYHAAAQIVVLSSGLKEILVARGVAAEKIHVVLNWVDEDMYRPIPVDPAIRSTLGPLSARVILYAGNLGDYQGLDSAVRAADSLGGRSRLQLVLMGDGIARPRLEKLVRDLDASNIRLLPRREPHEMPAFHAAADAHLISLVDLPFFAATIPGKTQVALAAAKPIIMAVRGDAANLVNAARAGLACTPDEIGLRDAFERIARMTDSELAVLGQNGRDYYQSHLSLERATTRIERILLAAADR
jgi:colanic acid biosynthesis glycosyl transferase WcaI